jgi:hypothetical protein
MDKIKEKLNALRTEADAAHERGDVAEAKVKKLEQALLERDNDIQSLTHKLQRVEGELDVAEQNVKETTDKCVPFVLSPSLSFPFLLYPSSSQTGRRYGCTERSD